MSGNDPNRRKMLKGMAALGSIGIGSTLNVSVAAAEGEESDPVTVLSGSEESDAARSIAQSTAFTQLRQKAVDLGYSFAWSDTTLTVAVTETEDFKREVASYELQDAAENSRAGIILGRHPESQEIAIAQLDVEYYHDDGTFKKLEQYDLLGDDSSGTDLAIATDRSGEIDGSFTKTTEEPSKQAVEALIDDLSHVQDAEDPSAQLDLPSPDDLPDLPDELNFSGCDGCYFATQVICKKLCGAFGKVVCGVLGISVAGGIACVTIVKAICKVAEATTDGCGDDISATICKSSGLDVCEPDKPGEIIEIPLPNI
ncbi:MULTISPECIES: halocin C8-like domain-containing protein [Halobacterium]|uniref:halocin C8-like domain-containing protein n=1 Tax=Halobacterium TaxID=2239 RepID=UPI001E5043EF|nr:MULTISPECIES: halocin C8-like domain-containing protein [Halobacterium]WJK64583.1 halocin C8-like domain-containing protein [Halobacterium salinarum]